MKTYLLMLSLLLAAPATGEYTTDIHGVSKPVGDTRTSDILATYKITPNTLIIGPNKKSLDYFPKPYDSYTIKAFVLDGSGRNLEIIVLEKR